MELHELSGLFPPMSETEFSALKNDIQANGQREPIWLLDDKVIDGKHRLRACEELGIEPAHREYCGSDPIAFVVSMNLHRRQLEHGQRAMIGDRIRDAYDREAKERQKVRKGNQPGATPAKLPDLRFADSRDAAGKAVGVSGKSIDQARRIRQDGVPELAVAVEAGAAKVYAAAEIATLESDAQQAAMARVAAGETTYAKEANAAHNQRTACTGNNEWYTPAEYLDAARKVMGGIDLDPASHAIAQKTVKAAVFFSQADDGLSHEWIGRVWLNPPYSQPDIQRFADKLVAETVAGRISQAIVLTNSATDTAWFHVLGNACASICFPRGRIRFLSKAGQQGSPLMGQAFFYFGTHQGQFQDVFSKYGLIVG